MNTLRVCATVGLGLSLVLGSGCKSDSKSGGTDGSTRDTRRTDAPQNNQNPDTTSAGSCTIQGNTVQPGRTIVINCITWTCQGDNNVTGNGTACSDAGPTPDVFVNRDTAAPADTRPVDSGSAIDGGKDTQPVEAGTVKLDGGNKDVAANKDAVADAVTPEDTGTVAPEDTGPVTTEDAFVPTPDSPSLQCTSGGTSYNPGDTFTCGCNSCFCNSAGVTQQLTNYVPGDTFSCDSNCNTCLCNSSNAIQHLTNNTCTVDAAS